MLNIKKEDLPDFAFKQLRGLVNQPGKILYSSHETLCQGDVYLLGYNPGGSEGPSISDSISNMLSQFENAYFDEDWSNGAGDYKKGEAPLQKRVDLLITALGYDLKAVCASNLIFAQSVNAHGVSSALADVCWPVHEAIMSIVKPKVILVFGNSSPSPFLYLHNKYQGEVEYFEAGHGDWQVKTFKANIHGRSVRIIGFPHFSYYSPEGNERKELMINWVNLQIAS
jgi:hypothetical protein